MAQVPSTITATATAEATAKVQEIAILEQQINAIKQQGLSNGGLTQAQDAKLRDLQDSLTEKKGALNTPSETTTTTVPGSDIAHSVTKADFMKSIKLERDCKGQITYLAIKDNDIVSYINATKHINPWNRMRQCDDDLINLLGHVGAGINNEIGEWIEIGNQVSKAATS